jgi:hypothetical protein
MDRGPFSLQFVKKTVSKNSIFTGGFEIDTSGNIDFQWSLALPYGKTTV